MNFTKIVLNKAGITDLICSAYGIKNSERERLNFTFNKDGSVVIEPKSEEELKAKNREEFYNNDFPLPN
jgi:hypothetical protein